MVEEITVEISCRDKEIRKVLTYFFNRKYKVWVMFPCFTAVFAILVYNAVISRFNVYYSGLILVFLLTFLVFYVRFYSWPINSYMNFYNSRKGRTFIFDENEVRILSENVHSTCKWSIFKKAYDLPSAYILLDENGFAYIFLKHCMKGTPDIDALGKLIKSKMSKIILL